MQPQEKQSVAGVVERFGIELHPLAIGLVYPDLEMKRGQKGAGSTRLSVVIGPRFGADGIRIATVHLLNTIQMKIVGLRNLADISALFLAIFLLLREALLFLVGCFILALAHELIDLCFHLRRIFRRKWPVVASDDAVHTFPVENHDIRSFRLRGFHAAL